MTLRISGKSISVGEALRGRVADRTDEVLRKYFDGNYSGHITLSKDGFGFRTDCALHLDSGITLEADSNAPDAYASADQALLMIEKRLRRYKSRLKDRSARKAHATSEALAAMDATSYVLEPPGEGEGEDEVTGYSPVIIAEATTSLKLLSVSEAVMNRTTATGGSIARMAVAIASCHSASSSVVYSIFLMPVTMVCIESCVVIRSGHRY